MSIGEFRAFANRLGIHIDVDIYPDQWVRVAAPSKPKNNKDVAFLLFSDCRGGVIFDHSTGVSHVWQSEQGKQYTHQERERFKADIRHAKVGAERERTIRQETASVGATSLYREAKKLHSNYPYLVSKGVRPFNARFHNKRIVIPLMDFTGKIWSVQHISADGKKMLLKDGRKKGNFSPINIEHPDYIRVIICEGWATGATLAENYTDSLVLAAIDAGNLLDVGKGARLKYPQHEIVIAGDDDRSKAANVGRTKATEAAKAINATLIFPNFPSQAPLALSDFNDLANYLAGDISCATL